jgi:hypothetical protein
MKSENSGSQEVILTMKLFEDYDDLEEVLGV